MQIELNTTKATRVPPPATAPNIVLIVLDAVNWKAWEKAAPENIPRLLNAEAVEAHSFACCTLPALVGFLSNYPPIGIGRGLFDKGSYVMAQDLDNQARHHPTRSWMPLWYQSQGYHTSIFSGNAVLAEANQDMNISRGFTLWKVKKFLTEEVLNITPKIIMEFEHLCLTEGSRMPLFSVLWLFDTHYPFSDGRAVLNPSFWDGHATMKACVKALKYTDQVVIPAIVEALLATNRRTQIIITSDHGENHGGDGAGHNPFHSKLRMSDDLFAIPYIEGILKP